MFAVTGALAAAGCNLEKDRSFQIIIGSCLLDVAGAITLIVLGALALTGHGGSIINSLNTTPGGAWAMMGGGLAVCTALYAYAQFTQNNAKLNVMREQLLSRRN